ncbi:hypothetical protein PLESTF_001092800 [Pleodorina starrii]|nr:hypothetical protein PLESTF_001092800 [Pleodorina starrii]
MDVSVDDSSPDVGQNVNQQVSAVAEKQSDQQPAHHGQQSDAHAAQRRGSAPEDPEDDDEPSPVLDGETEDCDDLDDDELDHDMVRQEAWAICRVRELAKACARLSGPLLPTAVERAARRIARYANRIGGFPPEPEPLTPLEVAALQAALREAAAATAFPHTGHPTAEGVAAVEQLAQQALEGIDLSAPPPPPPLPTHADGGAGPGAAPWPGAAAEEGGGGGGEEGISVELLVRAGSERISALSWGLSCLLRRTASPRNVFGVLLLGRCLGCPELAEEGLLAAIANFPAAVAADKRHFLLLDDASLLLITSNSNLQVTQELDVWEAIAEWVQHSWESRRVHLYDLLQAGVRLSHLDTLQLSQLQRHPLLLGVEPGPASQLVGAAYSARILSNVHRSRNRQRGAAAAAAAGAGAGGYLAQPTAQVSQQQQQQLGQGGSHHGPRPMAQALQQQQQVPSGVPQQRPQPHAALQQLIGSLQARAAAAKAKQQQQQQQQQQQAVAAAAAAAASAPSAAPPRSPPHLAEEGLQGPGPAAAATGSGSGTSAAELRQQPGSSGPSSTSRGGTLPHAAAGATTTHGAVGSLSFSTPGPGSPEALGGLCGHQQRRPSPGPLPMLSSPQAGEGGAGGGGGGGSADKRQLASMLAQAIAKAAARQGLPRIQLGAGGAAVTPGAVQAALSAAQAHMDSNPALQEMLREAKAQVAQANHQQQEQQQQEYPHHHPHTQPAPCRQDQQQQQRLQQLGPPPVAHSPPQLPRPPPLAVPVSVAAHAPSSSALPACSPSPSSSSLSPALAISPGLASQLLLPGSQPQPQPGQQEPGRPPPPSALALQQLLQIAAAVQKAVRSGQPQPPHVRQQLQQLQAFISRQLAATPAGSQQQPLLLTLQSMLAGAASSSADATQPPAAAAAGAEPPSQQAHGQQQQQQAGPPADQPLVQGSPQQEQEQHPQIELRPSAAEPGALPAAGSPDPQHTQPHGRQQEQQEEGPGHEGGSTGQDVAQGRGGGEGGEAPEAAAAASGIGRPSGASGGTEGGGGRGGGGGQEGGGEPDPKRRRRMR